MKKISGLILLVLLCGGAFYLYSRNNSSSIPKISDYSMALKKITASGTNNSSSPVSESPVAISLSGMLNDGIKTSAGVIQSHHINNAGVDSYSITLDDKVIGLKAVSSIDLVQAFLIESKQVMLFSFNQGGNQCSQQYQILTISNQTYKLSEVFGNCLPLSTVVQRSNELFLTMPQNNPFLGTDITETYIYHNGAVKRLSDADKDNLRKRFSNYTAAKIIQLATNDGCLVDGVFLDDNSCGGGRKYCVMFRNLPKAKKDASYRLLKNFCSQ